MKPDIILSDDLFERLKLTAYIQDQFTLELTYLFDTFSKFANKPELTYGSYSNNEEILSDYDEVNQNNIWILSNLIKK